MQFGTEQAPIRPSAAAKLLTCEGWYMYERLLSDSLGGVAAQTGNAVHAAVQALHTYAGDRASEAAKEAALGAMAARVEEFPAADFAQARSCFAAYATREAGADVVHVELPVRCQVLGIWFGGTLDQIRRNSATGQLEIWDLKTGSKYGPADTLATAFVQQCVYLLAARATLGVPIAPGGILRYPAAKPLGPRESPELRYKGLTVERAEAIVTEVAQRVLRWRERGTPLLIPIVSGCTWCPGRGQCPAVNGDDL